MREHYTVSVIFDTNDADAWYIRNAAALTAARCDDDPVTRAIEDAGILTGDARRVCELGASNGWRLAGLSQRYPDHAYTAMDLSPKAVAAGQEAWPHLCYSANGLEATGAVDGAFNVAIVSYVLHWIDRDALPTVVREIDRILTGGGVLVLADFWPTEPIDVPFKHRPGLWTYKRDYRTLFKGWPTTREAQYADAHTGERCAVVFLRKPHGSTDG